MTNGTPLWKSLFFEKRLPWRYKKLAEKIRYRFLNHIGSIYNLSKAILLKRTLAIYVGWAECENLGDLLVFDAYKKMFPKIAFIHCNGNDMPSRIINFLYNLKIKKPILALGGGTLINQLPEYLKKTKKYIKICDYSFCAGTGVADEKFWTGNPKFSKEWSQILKKIDRVGVRGQDSISRLNVFKLNKNINLIGDAAIYLSKQSYRKKEKEKTIGINFTKIASKNNIEYSNLEKNMLKVVEELIKKQWKIKLVPIYYVDYLILEAFRNKINGKENVELIKSYLNFNTIHDEISKCDVFIGEKLHSGVIAAMTRTPFALIEYQPKCRDFMRSIDFLEFSIRNEEIEYNTILGKINKLYNHKNYQTFLDKQIKKLLAKQEKFIEIIKKDLEKRNVLTN